MQCTTYTYSIDYLVDSSGFPADLQWIKFVLESPSWKIIYLVCKMCKTLYNNCKYFSMQYIIDQDTNNIKIKLAGNVVFPFVFCPIF